MEFVCFQLIPLFSLDILHKRRLKTALYPGNNQQEVECGWRACFLRASERVSVCVLLLVPFEVRRLLVSIYAVVNPVPFN